jgi:hypothetical protein
MHGFDAEPLVFSLGDPRDWPIVQSAGDLGSGRATGQPRLKVDRPVKDSRMRGFEDSRMEDLRMED